MDSATPPQFDVFLSYSHQDAAWVEDLARRLEDDEQFRVWLDKWVLIPGAPWQQEMARGLGEAHACAVCIGAQTPEGWFGKEIEKALNRQAQDPAFRVIPVLLPEADREQFDGFLELNTWVDFRVTPDYAHYLLACGILGVAPGRPGTDARTSKRPHPTERKLRQLREWKHLLEPQVLVETQQKLLDSWIQQ